MDFTVITNKHKNKLINVTIIVLALIISSNIYRKQTQVMNSLEKTKEVEVKKSSVIENIKQIEHKMRSYKNLLIKQDSGLIINIMGGIAKQSGVKIISVRPDAEQKYLNYVKSPFSVVLSAANYHAIGKFISKLESYPDVYMVETLDIKSEIQTRELAVNLRLSSIAFTD